MSVLAIAFPAEVAVPVARTVINSVSNSPVIWGLTVAGIALLLVLPVHTSLGHIKNYFIRQP